jgi:hypothetical protein
MKIFILLFVIIALLPRSLRSISFLSINFIHETSSTVADALSHDNSTHTQTNYDYYWNARWIFLFGIKMIIFNISSSYATRRSFCLFLAQRHVLLIHSSLCVSLTLHNSAAYTPAIFAACWIFHIFLFNFFLLLQIYTQKPPSHIYNNIAGWNEMSVQRKKTLDMWWRQSYYCYMRKRIFIWKCFKFEFREILFYIFRKLLFILLIHFVHGFRSWIIDRFKLIQYFHSLTVRKLIFFILCQLSNIEHKFLKASN